MTRLTASKTLTKAASTCEAVQMLVKAQLWLVEALCLSLCAPGDRSVHSQGAMRHVQLQAILRSNGPEVVHISRHNNMLHAGLAHR